MNMALSAIMIVRRKLQWSERNLPHWYFFYCKSSLNCPGI